MGQRLIITEDEKNRIKLLYELTQTETTPPPDERELVIKGVNPFKHEEYVDARREYSPQLKDGDRFYFTDYKIGDDTFDSIDPSISFFYKEVFEPAFKNKLVNKTIRIPSEDIIYRINSVGVGISPERIRIRFKPDLDFWIYYTEDVRYEKPNFSYHRSLPDFSYQRSLPEPLLSEFKSLIELAKKLTTELKSKIDFYKDPKNISLIPDKYFNIFRVKRRNTDF